MQIQIADSCPAQTFIPHQGGFLFTTLRVGLGVDVVAKHREELNLGIVDMYELTIGRKGVVCGYWFSTPHRTTLNPNALHVYRNKLLHTKTKVLLADNGSRFQLKYRMYPLRVFTLGTDMVVVGSDLLDKMKSKLESQE